MPENIKIPSNKLKANVAYIIVIAILTVLAIGGSIIIYRFEYLAGAHNDAHYSFVYGFGLSLILFPLMALVAVSASILALVSLVLRHGSPGRILLKLVMILLGPVIVCCALFYTTPLSPIFLKGLEQWVKNEADIEAIQTWLSSEGAKHAGQRYSAEEGFPEELPVYLVELHPRYMVFSDSNSQDGSTVEIGWFLVMDDYGLIVGPPEMETPKKGRIKLRKDYYEFRRPVKPGAYVFIRG